MRFYGSAISIPHIQGPFQETLIAAESQCYLINHEIPMSEAVFAEPFAVALNGMRRAGSLFGRTVVVTGCGPIGALTAIAARLAGAEKYW